MKIGFMFLLVGKINHEDIWKDFFKYIDTEKYKLYLHPQNPKQITDPFFKNSIIPNLIKVKWGNIWPGFIQLLKEAILDPDITHFVWLSDSCIPIKSFDYIYNEIYNIKKTKINRFFEKESVTYGEWTIFPRCNNLLDKGILKENIGKNHAWILLIRKHAELFIDPINKEFFDKFNEIFAPEEHIPITFFNEFKLDEIEYLEDPDMTNCVTFVSWKFDSYKYYDEKYFRYNQRDIKTFTNISKNELDYLINTKSFFARKFDKNCVVLSSSSSPKFSLRSYLLQNIFRHQMNLSLQASIEHINTCAPVKIKSTDTNNSNHFVIGKSIFQSKK
jgi:hypothetical protein